MIRIQIENTPMKFLKPKSNALVIRTSDLIPVLNQKHFEFVSREGDLIKYRCQKNHEDETSVYKVRSLNVCKVCHEESKIKQNEENHKKASLLIPLISGTFWKSDDLIYDYTTQFTLYCDNNHTWKGNLKKFEKLKERNCRPCRLIYLINQITPVTEIITDIQDINHLKDNVTVMEQIEGKLEKQTYTVGNLLRKYKLITPLKHERKYESDSE